LERKRANIFNQSEYPQDQGTTATTLERQVKPEAPTSESAPARPAKHKLQQAFRFNLRNFLPGRGSLSLRRFSITEAAFLLMVALLASRGLGVLRQLLFNVLFGTGSAATAYYAAAYFPETLFDLVAGGALVHAFLPVFLSYEKEHGQREAWRLSSLVFNVMLLTLTVVLILGEFLTPAFVNHWLVPGYAPAEQALTVNLTRIMLLQPLLLGLGTVITAALNSKRQFLLPAFSVAIYNIGLIGGLGVTVLFPSTGIYGPTVGMLVAAALQALVMIPALVKQGARYSFVWNLKHPGLHEILRLLLPNVFSVAIGSIMPILDTAFISYMSDTASLAATRNAYMLFGLPLTLIAQAVGQAAMPQLAAYATARKYVRLRQTLLRIVAISAVLSVLEALALWLLGYPVIHLLFQHGAFTAHSTSLTYLALIGYAIALPGQALTSLLLMTFYSIKNALIPMCCSVLALGAHLAGLFFFLDLFSGSSQVLAIPLALAADGITTTLVLGVLLLVKLHREAQRDRGMQRLRQRRKYARTRSAVNSVERI